MCKECTEYGNNLETSHCDKCTIEYDYDGSVNGIYLCIQCLHEAKLREIFGTGSYEKSKNGK